MRVLLPFCYKLQPVRSSSLRRSVWNGGRAPISSDSLTVKRRSSGRDVLCRVTQKARQNGRYGCNSRKEETVTE
nr:MAG TPA: hypothetical protein [Caudoviricetes sp.]